MKKSISTRLSNRNGLHARPAMMFAQVCENFQSKIDIECRGMNASGKNILELMSLAIESGIEILITATGEDAEAATVALQKLIDSKFGEE